MGNRGIVGLFAFVLSTCACGSVEKPPCENGTVACGDACADFTKDTKNCGACGRDCLGGACESGVCQSVNLFTSATGAPYGIAVDSTNVYFTTVKEGSVYRCPKLSCVGSVTAMATGQSNASDVASDDKNVYWTTISAVMTCPTSGCPASGKIAFASGQNAPAVVVVTKDRVWWTNHGAGKDAVMFCPIAGCGGAPTAFADDQPGAQGLAVDGTNVFWTNAYTPGGTVSSCPIAGCAGAPTVIAKGLDIPQAIASDGKNVYWTNFTGQSAMFCPVTGCGAAPNVLTSTKGWYDGLVLDDANVYFTGGDGKGDALLRCPKTGCAGAPTVIAKGQTRPGKIAIDAQAIYWTASYTGAVTRVVK